MAYESTELGDKVGEICTWIILFPWACFKALLDHIMTPFIEKSTSKYSLVLIYLAFSPLILLNWSLKIILSCLTFCIAGTLSMVVDIVVRAFQILLLMFVFAIIVTILVRIFL